MLIYVVSYDNFNLSCHDPFNFIYCPFRSRAFYYAGTIRGGYFLVIGQCGRILIGLHIR